MHTNKYYTLEIPASDSPIWDDVVEKPDGKNRTSNEGLLVLVKTPEGVTEIPASFPEGTVQYTHAEISAVLEGENWASDNDL